MPSARPSKPPRKGCLFAIAAVSTLFLVIYALLATGSMEGVVRSLVHRFTAGQDVTVSVYGGSSNIFYSTSVDSVVVSNDRGLRVSVCGATISGSVYSYFFNHRVSGISVDSLVIIVPSPSDEPPDSSLMPVFTGTMAGIVTRTDNLTLHYGRVVNYDGTVLVDSMYLNGAIREMDHPEIEVREASSYIPLFGPVSGSGTLLVDSGRTSLEEFTAICPPGTFQVSGYLNADSTTSFDISGTASTGFLPEFPFTTVEIDGNISGSIPDPLGIFSIKQGCLNYDGLLIGLTADTISCTRDSCSLQGLHIRTGSVAADVSGAFGFSRLNWDGSVYLNLLNTDISSYFKELPETDLSGSLSASISGESSSLYYLALDCSMGSSRILEYSVAELSVHCSGNPAGISGNLTADLGTGSIESEFTAQLGLNYTPVAWTADLKAFLADFSSVSMLTDPLPLQASGLSVDVSGQGSLAAFSVAGSAELASFRSDSILARNAGFTGRFTSGSSGMSVSGEFTADTCSAFLPAAAAVEDLFILLDLKEEYNGYSGTCSLSVQRAEYDTFAADMLEFTGGIDIGETGISGQGWISSDSIFAAGSPYSLSASIIASPGNVRLDSLTLGAPGNLMLTLAGMFSYSPDSLGFSLDGIALTRAGKLRLISAGDLELSTDSTGILLDTLWLDLPSGEITADGWFSGDSLEVTAGLSNVDIASFTSMLGISIPISGILQAACQVSGKLGDIDTELSAFIDHPTYEEWDHSDSLTLDLSSSGDSLLINGLWSWADGVRSGLRIGFDGIWNPDRQLDISPPDIMWLEAELTGVGDELFYLLPMPFKTSGASVSARIEYQREASEFSAGIASHFERLYITNPGIEFPGVTMYLTYPDMGAGDNFNGTLTVASGEGGESSLNSTLLLEVKEDLTFSRGSLPIQLEAYDFTANFNGWETIIAGIGWMKMSGTIHSQADNVMMKPRLTGKINIDQAIISMGGGGTLEGSGSTSSRSELPIDISIRVNGERGIWFRNSYANAEFSTTLDITTVNGQLMVGGDVAAVRGSVYLLGRDFQITTGDVRILQTIPVTMELDVQAESRIRSSVSGSEYVITVTVTGDPAEPEITLTGSGPSGTITEQDIVTLLTAGMTYGELQQFDSTALGSVAGNYLGQWLANSIRDDVGLDALQFSPDFSSDTTSLVVNAGKYVLPDLFVSYTSDVFSSDAGTISAQYFFNRDFFLEGSTKSTLTGNQDPSLELHYTYRY